MPTPMLVDGESRLYRYDLDVSKGYLRRKNCTVLPAGAVVLQNYGGRHLFTWYEVQHNPMLETI